MKVGILTWHYYPNFGSSLQALALQEVLRNTGVRVRIINYRNPRLNHFSRKSEFFRFLLSLTAGRLFSRLYYPHIYFICRYLKQTRLFLSEQELSKHACHYDAIVCGSDQIWAPNVYNPVYFASFFEGKKISYAASIGLSSIPENLVTEYQNHLNSFSNIGVREEEGKKLLKDSCGLEAVLVLDPTLLLPVEYYKKVERRVKIIAQPFVFCYFLNPKHQYKNNVIEYAERNGLCIVGVSANMDDSSWMKLFNDISACEFLWLIDNASLVLTDSYHGTIFSLLYHKEFRTYIRFSECDPISQNSRIRQLDSYFGINCCIQRPDSSIETIVFDFSAFDKKLDFLRKESLSYLKRAIEC